MSVYDEFQPSSAHKGATSQDASAAGWRPQLKGSLRGMSYSAGAQRLAVQKKEAPAAEAEQAFDGDAVNTLIQSGDAAKRQQALDAVVAKMKGEGVDFSDVKDSPVYDDAKAGAGSASRESPSTVTIGQGGMGADWKFLQLVIEHEIIHTHQWKNPENAQNMGRYEREFLATLREFEVGDSLGLEEKGRAYNYGSAKAKLTRWYDKMTAEKQTAYKDKYEEALKKNVAE